MKANDLRQIMQNAWHFFRITGQSFSECLKKAWANFHLIRKMMKGIVKFYYRKVDGTVREAYGTLKGNLIAAPHGEDNRRRNETVQVYFDTEKQEWRCFKKLNLVNIQ